MLPYYKSNLIYTVFFPQFLISQQNNSAPTSVLIFFTSRHYYFFEKLKIVEKQLCKLSCSYGKVSHTLNRIFKFWIYIYLEILDRFCVGKFHYLSHPLRLMFYLITLKINIILSTIPTLSAKASLLHYRLSFNPLYI